MRDNTIYKDIFGVFFNPLRTVINSTDQSHLELIKRNDELVLYTDPTTETSLNSLPQDTSMISHMNESFPQLPSAWHSFTNSRFPDNFSEDSLISMENKNSRLWQSSSTDPEVIEITNKLNDVVIEQKWDISKFHSAITELADILSKNKTIQDSVPEYLGKFGNQTLNEAVGKILHSNIDQTLWNIGEFVSNYPTAISILPASFLYWKVVKAFDTHYPIPNESKYPNSLDLEQKRIIRFMHKNIYMLSTAIIITGLLAVNKKIFQRELLYDYSNNVKDNITNAFSIVGFLGLPQDPNNKQNQNRKPNKFSIFIVTISILWLLGLDNILYIYSFVTLQNFFLAGIIISSILLLSSLFFALALQKFHDDAAVIPKHYPFKNLLSFLKRKAQSSDYEFYSNTAKGIARLQVVTLLVALVSYYIS